MLEKRKNSKIIIILLVCIFMVQFNSIKVQAVEKSEIIQENKEEISTEELKQVEVISNDLKLTNETEQEEFTYEYIQIDSFTVEESDVYINISTGQEIQLEMNLQSDYEVNDVIVTYGSKYHDYCNFDIVLHKYSIDEQLFKGSGMPSTYVFCENEVKYVVLETTEGNIELNKNDLEEYSDINLNTLNLDIEAYSPVLSVDKYYISPGESVKISADLKDFPLGISEVILRYSSFGYANSVTLNMTYNRNTKMYEATYKATNLSDGYSRIVSNLSIKDTDGNWHYIYNDGYDINLFAGMFYVKNDVRSNIDGIKTSVSNDKINIKDSTKVYLSDIELYNGEIIANYLNTQNDRKKSVEFKYNSISKKWEADFKVSDDLDIGTWEITNIKLKEKKDNGSDELIIYNSTDDFYFSTNKDLSNCNIYVSKNTNREDVNNDGLIDIVDIALVAEKYNLINSDKNWDANIDVNEDKIVDLFDITLISKKL